MKPHCDNACSGRYNDWLEVMLTDVCPGTCEWCIEKDGFKPSTHVEWSTLARLIVEFGKKNVVLLGGEPTLYKHLASLILYLKEHETNVYITTNGITLTPDWIKKHMVGVYGVNISIHHYNLGLNGKITGIDLEEDNLRSCIRVLHEMGATVRFNCNCIVGEIDSRMRIYNYIEWAKWCGVDSVRFAELKNKDDSFVDLHRILDGAYDGINQDPFTMGCSVDAVIGGMPVNFRQMCGLQTRLRPKPTNPEQVINKVLYYDGNFYDGWQSKGVEMSAEKTEKDDRTLRLLRAVKEGIITPDEAAMILENRKPAPTVIINKVSSGDSGGCMY